MRFRISHWVFWWNATTLRVCSLSSCFPLRPGKIFLQSRRSSVSAPPIEYGYVEEVEDLSHYRTGGYHPVRINDRLNQQYRIVHKLGHGTFSTAWLAIHEETSRYVAIKIGTADADRIEVDVLSQLTQGAANRDNSNDQPTLIPIVLDRFVLRGPNGTHPCFVTLPAWCSLRDAKEASGSSLFQLDVARSLAAQLAMAVSLVHSQGYAHGDIHLGNLMLQLPASLNSLSIEELYLRYGEPDQQPVIRLDTQKASDDPGVPPYAVPPVWLGVESDKVNIGEAKLILSDFGLAFRPSNQSRFISYTPLVLRPPEAYFEPGKALTFGSDIWSLGCVFFELLAHRSLIDGFLAPQNEITAQQVELQSVMPPDWWEKWEKRSKWYDDTRRPLSDASDIWPWERRFEQWVQSPRRSRAMETISDQERDALFPLLKWMLAWRPGERPDINEVLKTEWMTKWAIPAYRTGLKSVNLQLSDWESP